MLGPDTHSTCVMVVTLLVPHSLRVMCVVACMAGWLSYWVYSSVVAWLVHRRVCGEGVGCGVLSVVGVCGWVIVHHPSCYGVVNAW